MSNNHRRDVVVLVPTDQENSDGILRITLTGSNFIITGDELTVYDGSDVVGRFEVYLGAFFADALVSS